MMNVKNLFAKKNNIIIAMVLLVIVIVAIVLTIVAISTSKKSRKELISAVDAAWNTVQTEDQSAFLTKIDELSSYEITSVSKSKGKYILNVVVTAPDLGETLLNTDYSELPQTNDAEAINAYLCEQIEKSKIKKTATNIYADKVSGEYKISFSADFVDAMSGNLYNYSQKTMIDITKKYEGEQAK